jgi:hypothetical protein
VACGCELSGPGEVAIGTLDGNPGNNIPIFLMLHSSTTIQMFQIEVVFPMNLVTLNSTVRGSLTPLPWNFNAFVDTGQSLVRIGGFTTGGAMINPGTVGSLARLNFTVSNPGCATFRVQNATGQLAGYALCPTATTSAPGESTPEISLRIIGLPGSEQRVVYGLQEATPVSLEVVDVRGRVIQRLFERLQPIGSHAFPLDTESYAGGVYFVRLTTERAVSAAKFVVVH